MAVTLGWLPFCCYYSYSNLFTAKYASSGGDYILFAIFGVIMTHPLQQAFYS